MLWSSALWPACRGDAPPNDSVDQEVAYIWPMMLWSIPIMDASGDKPHARLATVGEVGFDLYLREVLPKELELDPAYKRQFDEADGSRVNLAFLRWQKRVFSLRDRVPVEEINWDGKPVPRYPGISYEWPDLYNSPDLQPLVNRISTMCNAYFDRLERNRERRHFRTFIWAEVYRPNDFQQTHVHTGALAAGMFVARYAGDAGREQQLAFEDPRGPSSPFGRKHHAQLAEGELLIWPGWAPHHLTPNKGNGTNVYFSFLVWPPQGAPDFDWEDDVTGDFVHRKLTKVRRQPPVAQTGGARRGAARGVDEL